MHSDVQTVPYGLAAEEGELCRAGWTYFARAEIASLPPSYRLCCGCAGVERTRRKEP